MKKGKNYEIHIEKIYKKIDPDSKIKRNDRIYGFDSGIYREIDLSIRHQIGPHEVLMIVQSKDYKIPVDVNVVGEFISVIQDVRANKGILISPKGFTNAATELARNNNIDILTAHDLNNPRWTIDLKMPVVLSVYSGSYSVNFHLVASQEYADAANSGKKLNAPPPHLMKISEDGGKNFFTIQQKFEFLCAGDHLKFYDGEEHGAEFMGKDLQLFVMEGVLTPLQNFKFRYRVKKNMYYKYFDVKEFQGLIDTQKNIISRANVELESDDFSIHNFDIIQKKDIDLTRWNIYSENINLIHPYHIKCHSLNLSHPTGPLKWEPAGVLNEKNSKVRKRDQRGNEK